MSIVLVLSTVPDSDCARHVARTLVGEGLAACVNVVPGLLSVYQWQGAVEEAQELLLLIKCSRSAAAAVQKRLKDLHPYELPEILMFESTAGLPAYLEWVVAHSSAGPINDSQKV